MRLERHGSSVRMVTINSRIDHTRRLQDWASSRLDELADLDLSGYVFKADSPSCGVDGVKVFDEDARPEPAGRGLFAAALIERFPHLPVEDERRLADPSVRDAFMRRVVEYGAGTLSPVRTITVARATTEGMSRTTDHVAVEEPLEIRLHDRSFAVIMRTPGADRELTAGFLLAEGVICSHEELGAIEGCRHPDRTEAHNIVNVFVMGEARGRLDAALAQRRSVLSSTSCGICGRTSIDSLKTRTHAISSRAQASAAVLRELPETLRSRQSVFDRTGGLHAAALFTLDGALITSAEDVGRHNAVDKVIGRMLLDERLPLTSHGLVVSGRTSFEIVQKAWLAGIEIICAVSAPSSLAIELAEEAGITLIGFARPAGFNIYTHSERVQY